MGMDDTSERNSIANTTDKRPIVCTTPVPMYHNHEKGHQNSAASTADTPPIVCIMPAQRRQSQGHSDG